MSYLAGHQMQVSFGVRVNLLLFKLNLFLLWEEIMMSTNELSLECEPSEEPRHFQAKLE